MAGSVEISSPKDGGAFPDPIKGEYSLQIPEPSDRDTAPPPFWKRWLARLTGKRPAARRNPQDDCTIPASLRITVTVSSAKAKYKMSFRAGVACRTDTAGYWEVPRPKDLPKADDYLIAVVSTAGGAHDVEKIHHP